MIPVNKPIFEGNEEKYLLECIRTGWISSEGPFISKFEEQFSKFTNRNFGVAVSNGSAALDIAVKALGLKQGDEVIVPTFTIISPVQSITSVGGIPVLVDSEETSWNMDVKLIEAKITNKTKAILVVHIYGLPVDMDPVLDLCKKYNLYLIEDAAELHGQTYKGKMCGSFGDISTFSFYPNKHITSGEGGMIVCNDHELAEKCKKLRNLSFEPNGRRFVHHEIGWNYRMTNLQAAVGLAQLENIDNHIIRKREIGLRYLNNLKSNLKGFQLPLLSNGFADNIFWVFGLVANTEELCTDAVNFLTHEKIGTRPFFWCMHQQPVFNKMNLFINESYPIAEKMASNGFYLPSGLGISNDEIDLVSEKLIKFSKDK
jgi:perosamine synthetase